MKAKGIRKYKQQQIETLERPVPQVGANDVLVAIYAASVNPIDLKIRDGKVRMLLSYDMPLILGNDFSGKVVKIGDKVTRFKIGDEVYGRPRKSNIGTFAEFISIDAAEIALKPKNTTFVEAASLPLVSLTSYQALHDMMKVQPEDKVLIQAGAGGVGTIAIQLAKIMGARVTTTASPKGFELVRRMGADEVINYRNTDFSDVLQGYDHVFDTLGGESLEKGFNILKPKGNIVTVSGLPNEAFGKEYGASWIKRKLFALASRKMTALEKKYDVSYRFLFMKPSGEQLELITDYVETGRLSPVVDRVFSFEETQEALDYSESGRAKGKIVIKMK